MPKHHVRRPPSFSAAPHPVPVRPRRSAPPRPPSARSRLVALILPARPAVDDGAGRFDEMLGALDAAIARSAHRRASA